MESKARNTAAGITIEEYLHGCVGFEVADSAITTILVDRDIEPGTSVADMDKRTKDLCKADLYMWCASTPSITGSVEDANGVWKHKEGGTQSSAYDKRNLRQMANDIYTLYGENIKGSKIRIVGMGTSLEWSKAPQTGQGELSVRGAFLRLRILHRRKSLTDTFCFFPVH